MAGSSSEYSFRDSKTSIFYRKPMKPCKSDHKLHLKFRKFITDDEIHKVLSDLGLESNNILRRRDDAISTVVFQDAQELNMAKSMLIAARIKIVSRLDDDIFVHGGDDLVEIRPRRHESSQRTPIKLEHLLRDDDDYDENDWAGSQKEETQAHSSMGLQKSSTESAGGWGSDNNAPGERGFKTSDSKNNDKKCQPSWRKSNTSNERGSNKSSQPNTSMGWGSGKANTQSCWEKSNDSVVANQTGKTNEAGGQKSWESGKEVNSTRSIWGQSRDTTPKNDKKTGECDSKMTVQSNSSSTWGSKKPETNSSDQAKEDGTSVGWGSNGEDGNCNLHGDNRVRQPGRAPLVVMDGVLPSSIKQALVSLEAGSQKEETQAHSSWGLQKSSTECDSGWGSDNNAPGERGFKSSDSKNNEQKSQPSWGKSNTSNNWGSNKSSQPNNQTGKTNEADGPKCRESVKEVNSTRSIWGQSRDTTPKNDKKTGECDSKKTIQANSSSTRGSKKPESDSSDQAKADGTSVGWGSKGEDGKIQSTWGQQSETAWKSSDQAKEDGTSEV